MREYRELENIIFEKLRAGKPITKAEVEILETGRHNDPLTGFLTRLAFEDTTVHFLDQYSRSGSDFTLGKSDLVDFGRINNVHGDTAGDAILEQVASQILNVARKSNYLGRYAGDQFLYLFPGLEKNKSQLTARAIQKAVMEGHYEVANGQKKIEESASMGIAIANASDFHYELHLVNGKYGREGRQIIRKRAGEKRINKGLGSYLSKTGFQRQAVEAALEHVFSDLMSYRGETEIKEKKPVENNELLDRFENALDRKLFQAYMMHKAVDGLLYKGKASQDRAEEVSVYKPSFSR